MHITYRLVVTTPPTPPLIPNPVSGWNREVCKGITLRIIRKSDLGGGGQLEFQFGIHRI